MEMSATMDPTNSCYIRDPDGYLIEVGQTTLARGWRPPS
jgi:hypothetical protein